ncbi:stage III sporulation protein AF [Brevibacillus antibioticus]|uniref:Stage III sporulation protein AF n=1 Tax=Brevibacillus antibioticus TaxID=2570228 RepID=A0A4U2Y648_9BACL|nr:stage III sporulation protein AF [Brevibacillus antibioticus]TKI55969.1 stage III sporulation protein AF [Brevibacillus antibioticus]
MTWLTLWLKKIILLVLLAAFLDLILPNTTLQRYVKMVMGLILLLTIISPVFSLFSLSQEDLAFRLDRYQQELNKPASAEWKRITDKLLGQQNQQITAYVQSQVASSVKASVKEQYGVTVEDVTITLNKQNPEQPTLERIELLVGDANKEEQKGQSTIEPIKPVQPVEITIGKPIEIKPDSKSEMAATAHHDNPLYAQITNDVAKEWGLSKSQVVIKDESREREKQ